MKPIPLVLASVMAGALLRLPAADGVPASGGAPGDGGDADPATFSFHADSRIAPLAGENGEPLRPEDVPVDYGRRYAVLADGLDVAGVEHAWALGYGGDRPRLRPRYQDLSRWEDAPVESGWLAVDPLTGRFKFAAENRVASPLRIEHRRQVAPGNLPVRRIEARGRFALTIHEGAIHEGAIQESAIHEEETRSLQAHDAALGFRRAGHCPASGHPVALALGGTHAYTAGGGYLSVHDIVDPERIRHVKTIQNGGSDGPFDLCVDRERARLYQNSAHGLLVHDIADGDDPLLVEIYDGLELPHIQVDGGQVDAGHLFGLMEDEGTDELGAILLAFRRSPQGLLPAGRFPLPGRLGPAPLDVRRLLVLDGLAFLILSTGLHVPDVRDPVRPFPLAQVPDLRPVPGEGENASGARDLCASRKRLFVACGTSRGGEVRIYDLEDPAKLELLASLDAGPIGQGAIAGVAAGDGVLFVGSRSMGVLAYDITEAVRSPRLIGGPPGQLAALDASIPRPPGQDPPPVGRGRWKGKHLFAPGPRSLEVHRREPSGKTERVLRFPVAGPVTHLEIQGDGLFLFGLSPEIEEPVYYLWAFEIKDPERPRLLAGLKAPTDGGGPSSEVFYHRGLCFLPGGNAARHAGGGEGGGNFPGIRVLDLRDPSNPRLHCLIHHLPRDVSVDSLTSPESFHAEGDTLYIADRFTGIHVVDIRDLAAGKRWRHLGVARAPGSPWSAAPGASGVMGHGRHLHSTHSGHLNIWEIPAACDVPRGVLRVRWSGKAVER